MLSPNETESKEKKELREKAPTPENLRSAKNDRRNSLPKKSPNAEKPNLIRTAILAPLRKSKMSQNKVPRKKRTKCSSEEKNARLITQPSRDEEYKALIGNAEGKRRTNTENPEEEESTLEGVSSIRNTKDDQAAKNRTKSKEQKNP